MNKYKGLTKHGNFWSVKKYVFGKQKWFNTGVRYSKEIRPQAETWYLKHFWKRERTFNLSKADCLRSKASRETKGRARIDSFVFFTSINS